MKQILLLQNQMEMTYYGHADCRKSLRALNRNYSLLTADTIQSMDRVIDDKDIDCILIGSNVLHDAVMRDYLLSEQAKELTSRMLAAGKGLILMMQYKAAYDDYPLMIVPSTLGKITAVPRPPEETATLAELRAVEHRLAPPLMRYPEKIDLAALERDSRRHQTLGGVYWHYWNMDHPEEWDVHVECSTSGAPRPLLVTSREHTGSRVILCALPLDWHGHLGLLSNVLTYATDGRHDTAFLFGNNRSELISNYLCEKLDDLGASHRTYDLSSAARTEVARNVFSGVHNTLFIDGSVELKEYFGDGDSDQINVMLRDGSLRIISVEPLASYPTIKVVGQRSAARDAFDLLTPAIGQALIQGYFDGSFRGTVSGLQELEELPHGLDPELFPLRRVVEEADRHDRAGSYDEVIGATAALLWLRAKALGLEDERTTRTTTWLRSRFAATDRRERLHSLGVLDALGLLTEEERALAHATLSDIAPSSSTEMEMLGYLEGAVRFGRTDIARAVVDELYTRKAAGGGPVWVDIATSATLIKLLIQSDCMFDGDEAPNLTSNIRSLVVPAMIALEDAYHRSLQRPRDRATVAVPWDGKLSTALKCLSAWNHFDRFTGAPVGEAAEAVLRSTARAKTNLLASGAIQSLRAVVRAYDQASQELQRQSLAVSQAAAEREVINELQARTVVLTRRALLAWAVVTLFVYVIGDHVYRTEVMNESLTIGESLYKHFTYHFTVLGIGAAAFGSSIAAIPWRQVLTRVETLFGARHGRDSAKP